MIEIVPASIEHAMYLALNLRDEDRAEITLFGIEPVPALIQSIRGSVEAWAALENGVPVAVWGVAAWTLIGGVGCPWLLTGRGVERHRKFFLNENRRWLKHVLTIFPRLETLVDARYARAIRWLQWLGFTVRPGVPFCTVIMEQ